MLLQLYRKIARENKNYLFSSHRTLQNFSEFLVLQLFSIAFSYFYKHEKIRY